MDNFVKNYEEVINYIIVPEIEIPEDNALKFSANSLTDTSVVSEKVFWEKICEASKKKNSN